MAPPSQKKRQLEEGIRGKTSRPKKRIRKQQDYHSSEDDDEDRQDFKPVALDDLPEETATGANAVQSVKKDKKIKKIKGILKPQVQPGQDVDMENEPDIRMEMGDDSTEEEEPDDAFETTDPIADKAVNDDSEDDLSEDENEDPSPSNPKPTLKRNDPHAFSSSISKILSTKLTTTNRTDPLLSRSRSAQTHAESLTSTRLEKKVRARQRAERKAAMEKGRVSDALGLSDGIAGEVAEEEKRLRKIAQRGVVKLFNAVRAAQVRAVQATKEEQKKGTVGMGKREERTKELSKDAFLSIINGGGSKAKA